MQEADAAYEALELEAKQQFVLSAYQDKNEDIDVCYPMIYSNETKRMTNGHN